MYNHQWLSWGREIYPAEVRDILGITRTVHLPHHALGVF
jgi:hypothetical protein